ncbi:MAG: UDP-glucose 4-epimerase GalE [Candidatus Cloacimonadota bacterium]|nr:MAG: UDP-glucose 4-epimerase GalE [Candidatus Cloacimonadota bacterium]
MKKLILVTGGTGFIGSHTCVELINSGYEAVIVDNLSNSKEDVIDKIEKITGIKIPFHKKDVTDYLAMREIFEKYKFDGIIHFAGYKAVGESVEKPLMYYRNNLYGTITLAEICREFSVTNFIFSSSATVYGDNVAPLDESMELLPAANPYGETKAVSERILSDFVKANPSFGVTLLRYFNPAGAHESGLIGEDPNGIPNNLMPYVNKVAAGELKELSVFGNDYETVDGTGIRDYIHVTDLAKGHIAALEKQKPGLNIYNLGTGKGTSVLELIHAFEQVNKIKVPFKFTERRAGDLAISYADPSLAEKEMGWKAEKDIADMCRDNWNFKLKNKQ